MNLIKSFNVPFELDGRPFSELTQQEMSFFACDYLQLHPNHQSQIILLDRRSAALVKSFSQWMLARDQFGDFTLFQLVSHKSLHDKWNSETGIQEVRDWLYSLEIPFDRPVFLRYDDAVVVTTWKHLIRYWDAFAWSVGIAMYAFDQTLTWFFEFHHEEVISFYTISSSVEGTSMTS